MKWLSMLQHGVYIMAQAPDFNTGEAFESMKNANAVIGILYAIIVGLITVCIILWKKNDKLNQKITDIYEERIKYEEALKEEFNKEINKLAMEIELLKRSKK